MLLNSISNTSNSIQQKAQFKPKRISHTTFCARPEFEDLSKTRQTPLASSFFRRGFFYGEQHSEFINVIDALKIMYSKEKKPKVLIAGLGERMQEVFSYTAAIKDLTKKRLEAVLELHCVDLQPKITKEKLEDCAFLDDLKKPPMFAQDSFEYSKTGSSNGAYHYKVKKDIFKFIKDVLFDKRKTKWDTKIEEFSQVCPKESYNMVSINNTLGYLPTEDARKTTMENLYHILKQGGILITDSFDNYIERFKCLKNFKELSPGIWMKIR